jgi:hypothetical protein
MPDIRTEAIKVMHSWSKPEKKKLSSSSDPLGKRMWEWLKQNPNSTIKQICTAFPEQKDSSVATGLKSLVDRGIMLVWVEKNTIFIVQLRLSIRRKTRDIVVRKRTNDPRNLRNTI